MMTKKQTYKIILDTAAYSMDPKEGRNMQKGDSDACNWPGERGEEAFFFYE
jgi:hypothetical protein